MTRQRMLFLLAFVLGFVAGWLSRRMAVILKPPPWESHPCSTCSIIHEPLGGCPADSVETPDFFTEKTGEKLAACFRKDGDGSLDVLMPGESFKETFTFSPGDSENDNAPAARKN